MGYRATAVYQTSSALPKITLECLSVLCSVVNNLLTHISNTVSSKISDKVRSRRNSESLCHPEEAVLHP